ncbi:hypothetical protein FHG87_014097 [Trinorchestia longiramus]|nr:hypothetical protein FHG87_014097 [Trinorchestia longiramus]
MISPACLFSASLATPADVALLFDSAASVHSSKHSLGDGRSLQVVDHEPVAGEAPGLSHTAARHKIAVRPRRTHALTRPRRPFQGSCSVLLPPTLEVNEETSNTRAGDRSTSGVADETALAKSRTRKDSTSRTTADNAVIYYGNSGLQDVKGDLVVQQQPTSQFHLHSKPHKDVSAHKTSSKSHFDPLNYHPDPHHVFMQHGGSGQPVHHTPSSRSRIDNSNVPSVHQTHDAPAGAELAVFPASHELSGADSSQCQVEKREEPLLVRLFGSVRSGRRRSRTSNELSDVSRDDSTSPMRRDAKLRSSAERKSESMVTKLPILKRSNSRNKQFTVQYDSEYHVAGKAAQEQDAGYQGYSDSQNPLELSHHQINLKTKAWSMENRRLEDKTEFDARSCSVDGRMEGHELESTVPTTTKPPITVPIASYVERQSRGKTEISVKKAKSFREVGNPVSVASRDSSRRSWFGRDSSIEYETTRLSASYDNLDEKFAIAQTKIQTQSPSVSSLVTKEPRKRSISKVALSPAQSSVVSSTDSLTTTEIPGVYIRPLSQYRSSRKDSNEAIESPSYFCTQQTHFSTSVESNALESGGGPLSLDSSITLIPKEEENIRKTFSSDHVSSHILIQKSDREPNERSSVSVSKTQTVSQECDAVSGVSVTEITFSGEPDHRSISVPGPASVSRSLSLSTSDTTGQAGVLNRRASSADELEQPENQIIPSRSKFKKRETSLSRGSSQETEIPSVPEFMRIQLNKVENKPQRLLYSSEGSSPHHLVEEKMDDAKEPTASSAVSEKNRCESQVSLQAQQTTPSLDRDNKENTPPILGDSPEDAAMLRSLKREKSVVMDPSVLPKKKEEEPELYKVFARRSFKVRESLDSSLKPGEGPQNDSNDLVASLSSHMSGITKINPLYSTPTPPQTPLISNSSSNKLGVGSPALSFKAPISCSSSTTPPPPYSPTVTESLTGASDLFSSASEPSSIESNIVNSQVSKPVSNLPIAVSGKNEQKKIKGEAKLLATDNSGAFKNETLNVKETSSSASSTASSSGGKINIRPMSANRELGSLSHSSTFTSTIISKALGSNFESGSSKSSATASPASVSVSRPLSQPVNSGTSNTSVGVTPVLWPPRSSSNDSDYKNVNHSSNIQTGAINKFLSEKPVEIIESETIQLVKNEDIVSSGDQTEELNLSQVKSVRLKFMNASGDVPSSVPTHGAPAVSRQVSGVPGAVIEARNTAPGFTVTVRAANSPKARQSSAHITSRSNSTVGLSSPLTSAGNHHRHSIGASYTPHPRQQIPINSSPSPPTPKRCFSSPAPDASLDELQDVALSSIIIENALTKQLTSEATQIMSSSCLGPASGDSGEATDDWRALVRQRREDRLKQSKSIESLDDTSEARGGSGSSRSSKVLEMASNFQKLQVA